jgi:transposase
MGSENRNGLSGPGGGGAGSGKGKSSSDGPTQKKARSKYDRAFKLEAIRLVEEMGMTGAQVARDLGIGQNILYRWLKAFREDCEHSFPGKGHMKPLEEENRQLKKRLAETEMERDILKKVHTSVFYQ